MQRNARRWGLLLAVVAVPGLIAGTARAEPGGLAALLPGNHAARTACADAPKPPTDAQGRIKVGTEVALAAESPDYQALKAGMNLVWRQEIHHPGASYIAPHFQRFSLPRGAAAVVRSPDNARLWTYTGQGKPRFGDREGFWGIHIPGDRAVVEVYSRHPVGKGAVRIDGYARGFARDEAGGAALGEPEAICGTDDSKRAQCYAGTPAYDKARAVARLMINGTSACTGWLVGSEGHLITNNHCISTASDASNTDYEFMAEGGCSQNCESWGACPGTVEASGGTLVQTDSALDYALIQLPTNISGTYGFMQMRSGGAVLDERIYIPQHPAAWGKRIAIESSDSVDGGFCHANDLNRAVCTGGERDVGYMCDTRGGSSGSPVLGWDDNAVVALHHCANCPNRGVPIEHVIADLGGNLPADSTTDGSPPPPPTCSAKGDPCGSDSECCTGKCRGKAGAMTCK